MGGNGRQLAYMSAPHQILTRSRRRILWSLAALVGATLKLGFVWLLADTLNAMMAIPNLIALALLSPIVFKLTKEFFDTKGKSENNPF